MKSLSISVLLVSGLFVAFGIVAPHAETITDPVPVTGASRTFEAQLTAGTPLPDTYSLRWTHNGVLVANQSLPGDAIGPEGLTVSRTMTVAENDVVCAQVAGVNAAGVTAYDQQCLTVALNLPPLPGQPLVAAINIM